MPDTNTEPFEIFVQWQRGDAHEHAVTVQASDAEMALTLAKRNVDVRSEPVSIWAAPRSELEKTTTADTTLVPSIDRDYRSIAWYAESDP